MTVIADTKSRVQLRRWGVEPGGVWAVESTERRIVLNKLERAKPKQSLVEHLKGLRGLELSQRTVHCPPRT